MRIAESIFLTRDMLVNYFLEDNSNHMSIIPYSDKVEPFVTEIMEKISQLMLAGFYEGSVKMKYGVTIRIRVRAVKRLSLLRKCGKTWNTHVEVEKGKISFILKDPPACLQLKTSNHSKIHTEIIFTYVEGF